MFLGNFVKRLGQVMDVSAIKMKYYYYYYYTLSASYMCYGVLEECIQGCSWNQSGFSNGCQHELPNRGV